MNLYLTVIPACHVPSAYCTDEKHACGYLRCNCMFMFNITLCCFNFYSPFKVLFIADTKISFDSFRNGMAATVNSKTIITVNPGKTSQKNRSWHKYYYIVQSVKKQPTSSHVAYCVQKKPSSSCCASRTLSVNHNLLSDTREGSLLFSYAKEVSESGALDQDEKPEDVTGMFEWRIPLILIASPCSILMWIVASAFSVSSLFLF